MPTGYTAAVADGKITDFQTFALQCARAFGALIMMRDEPSGAPIPERFEPSDYHAKRLVELRARYSELKAMDLAAIEAAAEAAHAKSCAWRQEAADKKAAERARYETMLEKVRAWTPPSADHVEMKKFMIDQLISSIDFDFHTDYLKLPEKPQPLEWYEQEIAEVAKDIDRQVVEHEKEVRRTEDRNQWVRLLRDSLAAVSEQAVTVAGEKA